MKEKLKKINKIVNIVFISISSVIICFAIALAIYFSVKYGNEEEVKADTITTDWYTIKLGNFTPSSFPFDPSAPSTSVESHIYNDNIYIKIDGGIDWLTSSRVDYRLYTQNNIQAFFIFVVDTSSLKRADFRVEKNLSTGVTSAFTTFRHRNTTSESFTIFTPSDGMIQLGNDWITPTTTDEQNILWCLSEFLQPISFTIYSGYYLFPNLEYSSYWTNIYFEQNQAELIVYSDTLTTPSEDPQQVERLSYALEDIVFIQDNLVANYQTDSIEITQANGRVYSRIFPILHLQENFTTQNRQVYEFLLTFYEIEYASTLDIYGQYLQPYLGDILEIRRIAYNQGYDDGIGHSIIADDTQGVISAIFTGLFGNIFKVEVFPNFPLYIFILIPVVFAVLSLILWLIRGK